MLISLCRAHIFRNPFADLTYGYWWRLPSLPSVRFGCKHGILVRSLSFQKLYQSETMSFSWTSLSLYIPHTSCNPFAYVIYEYRWRHPLLHCSPFWRKGHILVRFCTWSNSDENLTASAPQWRLYLFTYPIPRTILLQRISVDINEDVHCFIVVDWGSRLTCWYHYWTSSLLDILMKSFSMTPISLCTPHIFCIPFATHIYGYIWGLSLLHCGGLGQ